MVKRVRYAIITLVLAGAILNAWIAIDRQLALPKLVSATEIRAAIASEKQNLKNWPQTPSNDMSDAIARLRSMGRYEDGMNARVAAWEGALGRRHSEIFKIWELAAKVEFALIIGALCVWLTLPRERATT